MNRKTLTVLVVDDEPPMRRTIMRMVTMAGYEAQGAIDAADAIEKLRMEWAFDAVLTDYDMGDPDRTGGWLLEFMREHYPGVRRLLMSGREPDDEAISELVKNGHAERFLPKPVSLDTLSNVLDELDLERV